MSALDDTINHCVFKKKVPLTGTHNSWKNIVVETQNQKCQTGGKFRGMITLLLQQELRQERGMRWDLERAVRAFDEVHQLAFWHKACLCLWDMSKWWTDKHTHIFPSQRATSNYCKPKACHERSCTILKKKAAGANLHSFCISAPTVSCVWHQWAMCVCNPVKQVNYSITC